MRKPLTKILIAIQLAVLLWSCNPEELNTDGIKIENINPEYAVPLINSDLSLEDLIVESTTFIKKYNDGALSLVYRGQLFSSTAEEAINIPNQNFSETLSLTGSQANALMNGQAQTISANFNETFNLSGREIDSIWLKAGSLAASINSRIKTSGNLKITFIDAKKLNIVLSVDVPFTYNGSIPFSANSATPLASYHWNMSAGTTGYNDVRIKFELNLNPTSESLSAGDDMEINFGFNGMKFSRYYGYVGTVSLANAGDTIDLSVFDNNSGGQFLVEDPKIKIITANSYGVPAKAGFTKLSGYTSGTGGFNTPINGNIDPLPIGIPSINDIGKIMYDSVLLDKNTSNIKTVINQRPKQIIYQTYINLNPNGKQQRNFLTDESQLSYTVDVELPLYGSARNYVFEREKELKVDMPAENLIESILLRFTGDNGFPIDLITQAYLLDSSGNTFDSLFNTREYKFIEAAQVGTDGKVTKSTQKTTDIVLNRDRAKQLNKLRKIKLRAEFGTTSDGGTYPSVKLYSTYKFGFKLGVKAKLNLDFSKLDSLGK